jgi:hypothetical protein
VKKIAQLVETVPGVATDIQIPEAGNRYPTLTLNWDEAQFQNECAGVRTEAPRRVPTDRVLTGNNPTTVPGVNEGDLKNPEAPSPRRIAHHFDDVAARRRCSCRPAIAAGSERGVQERCLTGDGRT